MIKGASKPNPAKTAIYSIGYERRRGAELIALLRRDGIQILADVRKHPVSRKADFGAKALARRCAAAGIEYQGWPGLGSTDAQRDRYKASGDLETFIRSFRTYARKSLGKELGKLFAVVTKKTTALLCYERMHDQCHRSVIAELLAKRTGVEIVKLGETEGKKVEQSAAPPSMAARRP